MRAGTGILTDARPSTIRGLQNTDVAAIRSILEGTDVFSVDEVAVAVELMEIFLNDPTQKDYHIFTAVEAEEIIGYVCVGPTPLTSGTYDLYWIAVKGLHQSHGIGSQLLEFTERFVQSQGGRLLIAETSSRPQYDKTRAFYVNHCFSEISRIKDYYSPRDDLVIYGKYLSQ